VRDEQPWLEVNGDILARDAGIAPDDLARLVE